MFQNHKKELARLLSSYGRNNKLIDVMINKTSADDALIRFINTYNFAFLCRLVKNKGNNVPENAFLIHDIWNQIIPIIDLEAENLFNQYHSIWLHDSFRLHSRAHFMFEGLRHIKHNDFVPIEHLCTDPIKELVEVADLEINKDNALSYIIPISFAVVFLFIIFRRS